MSRFSQPYRDDDEPLPGYRLVCFLSKGNFGEVWMASAPGHKKVALKIIDLRGVIRSPLLGKQSGQMILQIALT